MKTETKMNQTNTMKTTLAFKLDELKTLKYEIECLRDNLKRDAEDAKQAKLVAKRTALEAKLKALNAKMKA